MTTVGLGTSTFYYSDGENPAGEGGLWANDALSLTYHATVPGLRSGLSLQQPSGSWAQTYGYDAARRLQTITSPGGSFTYTFRGAASLWTNLALPNTAAITNAYDDAGRLTSTWLITSAGAVLNKHSYLHDTAGRRQRQTLTDGSYTTYGYDDDSQLASSLGYTSGGTPIAAEQLGFGYDAGWNMSQRSVNGSPTSYSVNDLNELTTVGMSQFTYDANGNLVTNVLAYVYDDENRLTTVAKLPPGPPPGGGGGGFGPMGPPPGTGGWKTDFTYDGLGRLRVRQDYYSYASGWYLTNTTRYVYDGNRVIQERNAANTPTVGYTRGPDLSGTLEGAGGIGGLLARSHGYSNGTWSTHNFYHADGNGNITFLVNSAQGLAASYKYDPYGRTITSAGTLATANVYRFSSKEIHANNGMYYYLYRFYDPNLQRWLNRDTLGEYAGINLFRAFANSPALRIDPDGQETLPPTQNPGDDLGRMVYWACKCRDMVHDSMWGAHKWANDNFGFPGGMHSDSGSVADMLTHCVGACEVAKGEGACKKAGIDPRKYLQDREHGGTTSSDDKLDFENNKVGFGVADAGKDCKTGCLQALQQGQLWTRVGDTAKPYRPSAPVPMAH